MALLPKAANTEGNNETQADRTALPAGDYLVHIVKSELKKTKAGTGSYLSIHMPVLEPEEFKGRFLFENLNLVNPNPIAVEIANKTMNSICVACGEEGVTDSDELHQIPFMVKVTVEEATAQWPESNNITAYLPESDWAGADAPVPDADGPLPDDADNAGVPWQ